MSYHSPSSSHIPSPPYTPYSYSPEIVPSFQTYTQSPTFSHYRLPQQQSPPTSFLDNQSDCSFAGSPTKSMPTSHRVLASCSQSSLDSQHEFSPPYSAGGYSFPTPINSPSNSFTHGSSVSPADSTSCPYSNLATHHSPYTDASLPYLETLSGVPATTDAQAMFMPSAAGFSSHSYPTGDTSIISMTTTEVFPIEAHQNQLLQYQDPMFPSANTVQPDRKGYTVQAKARYTSVAVAGSRPDGKRQAKIESMDIKGISQWLQESAPVH